MINLNLPEDIQLRVRQFLVMNEQSLKTKNMIQNFIEMLAPSLKYAIMTETFKKLIVNHEIYK